MGKNSKILLNKWPFLISFLALLPLLNFKSALAVEWNEHVWLMTYFSKYFFTHHEFPDLINTQQWIGSPQALLKGSVFYRTFSLFSSPFGAGMALRVLILSLIVIQYLAVQRLFHEITKSKKLSHLVAIIWTFSIYPLARFFAYGAAAEFVSVLSVSAAVCLLVRIILNPAEKFWATVTMGFLFVMGAGSYLLTGVFGLIIAALLAPLSFSKSKNKFKAGMFLAGAGIFAISVLASWIYCLAVFVDPHTWYSVQVPDWGFLKNSWKSLAPFPIENADIPSGQVNILILGIAVFMGYFTFFQKKKAESIIKATVFSGAMIVIAGFLLLKTSPSFLYLINFAFLAILIAEVQSLSQFKFLTRQSFNTTFTVILVVGVMSLFVEFSHLLSQPTLPETEFSLSSPFGFKSEYAISRDIQSLPSNAASEPPLNFKVGEGENFGLVSPIELRLAQDSLIKTNVILFPWNQISVNASSGQLFSNQNMALLNVPAGAHKISVGFEPDSTYRILNAISSVFLLGWLCLATYGLRRSF